MRALILLLVALFVSIALPSLAENQRIGTRVIWYGDSYQDEDPGSNFGGLDEVLVEYGFDVTWTISKAGAQAYNYDGVDDCDAANNYEMAFNSGGKACNMIGVYMVEHHPTSGVCESFTHIDRLPGLPTSVAVTDSTAGCGVSATDDECCGNVGNTCVPTCLEDLPVRPADLCVVEFGTNDVLRGSSSKLWDTDWVLYLKYVEGIEAIVDHIDTTGIKCVFVTGIPYDPHPSYTYNVENSKLLADYLETTFASAHPQHRVLNMLNAYELYKAEYGTQAAIGLYLESETNADDTACAANGCIHPGENPNILGEIGRRWYAKHIAEALVGLARQ
jgi:hypothetical protein